LRSLETTAGVRKRQEGRGALCRHGGAGGPGVL